MRQQWRLNTVPHRARLFFTFGCGRILFVVHRNRKGRRHFEGLYVRGIQVADVLPGPVLVAERSANKVCVLVRVAGHLQLLVGETVLGRKKRRRECFVKTLSGHSRQQRYGVRI